MAPKTDDRSAAGQGARWSAIASPAGDGFRSHHELPVARRDAYQLLGRLHRKRLLAIARPRTESPRRDRGLVAEVYEREYGPSTEEFVRNRFERRDVFVVDGRPVWVDGWFTFEYRAELLGRALTAAGARTALEVGSGRGILLALLALRRPELELEGIELVAGGVARSYELAAEAPAQLLQLAGIQALSVGQETALARLRFHRGDAASMPFEDKAFDVSFTCLVLEQMPATVAEVVREMARVTRGYCVFLEPFEEANGLLGRAQLAKLDYFHGSYESFRDFGLEPVYFTKAIPQKVRFKTGLLVARVVA
jgi:SAM-dependent methyltransferase